MEENEAKQRGSEAQQLRVEHDAAEQVEKVELLQRQMDQMMQQTRHTVDSTQQHTADSAQQHTADSAQLELLEHQLHQMQQKERALSGAKVERLQEVFGKLMAAPESGATKPAAAPTYGMGKDGWEDAYKQGIPQQSPSSPAIASPIKLSGAAARQAAVAKHTLQRLWLNRDAK